MPIEIGIWRLEDKLVKVEYSSIENEKKLEQILIKNIQIIDKDLLVIGNQINTAYGKTLDILAINKNAELVLIELKRNKTPREVVAQLLDYATWVEHLSYDDVKVFFEEKHPNKKLEQAFNEQFELDIPDEFNETHKLIVVSSELDNSTERIINYLSTNGIPINAIFFKFFKENGKDYLTRSWLIDPFTTEENIKKTSKRTRNLIWNEKDWYVSLGVDESRNWDDCQRYGFISAGGGKWYSNTLSLLPLDARVFVCIPKIGYVGVGIVKKQAMPVRDFLIVTEGNTIPILEAKLKATRMGDFADDLEKSEYLVGIEWIKTVPITKAIWEKGMFANQNSACKLRNSFTIERLTKIFNLE